MDHKSIIIKGARVHNLKNIDLEIPKNKFIVFTGVSGSGKSSLAFDTIYAEGQRRYMESLSSYARQFMGSIEKPDVDYIEGLSPALAIDQHTAGISPRSTVGTMSEVYDYFRLLFAKIGRAHCPDCRKELVKKEIINKKLGVEKQSVERIMACDNCGFTMPEITISSFSFNNPRGACPACRGLGKRLVIDPKLVFPNPRLTLNEGAIRPWSRSTSQSPWYAKALNELAERYKFSLDGELGNLSKKIREIILYGDEVFEGVIPNLERRYKETDSDYLKQEIEKYMIEKTCQECGGKRLRKEVLLIKILGKNIIDFSSLAIADILKFCAALQRQLSGQEYKIIQTVVQEVEKRLKFLIRVGVGYLSLTRASETLSGGEAQRIRLATLLGSNLAGVIYILDEPSIGLHQHDQIKLLETLFDLRDLGNTVIVVEHDFSTMQAADYLVDLGPGAGELGGEIVYAGPPGGIKDNGKSATALYWLGKKKINIPSRRRTGNKQCLTIKEAREFNLKNITVRIPLNALTVVSGVSGSGKSTLITEILTKALKKKFYGALAEPGKHSAINGAQYLDKIVDVDQSPIGKSPRSNPATFSGVFGPIREFFASTPEAQARKYSPSHFSFNVKGGRCEACRGEGINKFEMYFLPNVYVTCEVCGGKRYNKEVLDIYYNGRNITDVLEMTIDEAYYFFQEIPIIKHKLGVMREVGLGYMRLGQPATTLSGGEAQRVKLATELARQDTGKTLYILDEPTTGLHLEDINRLLGLLQALVNKGNTVVIVEHNLEVIKCADHVIDLGPGGGEDGGQIVAEGTPEEIVKAKNSYTGQYLKDLLKN